MNKDEILDTMYFNLISELGIDFGLERIVELKKQIDKYSEESDLGFINAVYKELPEI